MATAQMNRVIQHLRRSALWRNGSGMTDGQLLECFVARREEAAFEALVERHGPMVLGVCRRVVGHAHDAEDAFQATFLVLVRKAASIVPREAVGNWLYGVAFRTALEARARACRQRTKEKQVKHMPQPKTESQADCRELQTILDRELSRLPDKYRLPVVLCELEGRSRKEVARQLALPEGTLSSRLATARKMLARRLARHGLAFSAGTLAVILSQNTAPACVPAPLLMGTVRAAASSAAPQAVAAGVISAKVAALTEGVLRSMLLTKLKIAAMVLLVLGIACFGAGLIAWQPTQAADHADTKPARLQQDANDLAFQQANGNQDNQQNEQNDKNNKDDGEKNQKDEGQKNQNDDGQKNNKDDGQQNNQDDGQKNQAVFKALDPAENTITVRRAGQKIDETLRLAKTVPVLIASKPGKLTDLKPGTLVNLSLSQDQKAVVGIREVPTKVQEKKGDQHQPRGGPRR